MRITFAVAAATVALAGSVVTPAAAAPPDPRTCTVTVEGTHTPADAGGLLPTGSVVAASAQVVCDRDVLNTPPAEYAQPWRGHVTLHIFTNGGQFVCGHGPDTFDTVGPLLVMAIAEVCVLPFNDPRRNQPMHVNLAWATMPPYNCCGTMLVPIEPVGAAVR